RIAEACLRRPVGVDEDRVWFSVVREDDERRLRVEPICVRSLWHERYADEARIAAGEEGEEFRVGGAMHRSRCQSQETIRIDINHQPDIALRFGRFGEPEAEIGLEVCFARGF